MIASPRGTFSGRAFRLARNFFLASVLFFSGNAGADTPVEWLKLLHYRKNITGQWTNDSGPAFFVSPTGARDSEAELAATQLEFNKPDTDFHCRFPARALWLTRLNPKLKKPSRPCPEWEKFKTNLAATGASVIFSSYYLNNPASAFGHSFLRINRGASTTREIGPDGRRGELLDTGIGYAATVTTQNAFLYGLYGAFGLFRGDFTAIPYYYKVREYADAENRDLWSYDLNLTAAELELLVAHLWELGSAEKNYYYFSKNCSYEIIALIEAIRPRSELLSRLPRFVIPSHTLQSLMLEPGLVRNIDYRPSARKRLEKRLDLLTSQERLIAHEWKATPSTPSLGAAVLDARIDWIDFESFKALVREDPETMSLKNQALQARAETGIKTDEPTHPLPIENEPSRGHPPRRLQLGIGKVDSGLSFSELGFRPALQDLLDPPTGYPDSARLEFINVRLRAERDRPDQAPRLSIEEFALFRAQSLTPVSDVVFSPSWKVGLGLRQERHLICKSGDTSCLAGQFEVAGGWTLPISSLRVFGLSGVRLVTGPSLQGALFKPAVGLEFGIHGRWGDRLAWLATLSRNLFLLESSTRDRRFLTEGLIEGRWSLTPAWGVGASLQRGQEITTWQTAVSYFF